MNFFRSILKWVKLWVKGRHRRPWHLQVGERGELHAKKFLKRKGFKYLLSHYTCSSGEIDLVFRDGQVLVFVEVKTRSETTPQARFPEGVRPAGAVHQAKREHLYNSIRQYLRGLKGIRPIWRCDLVEVLVDSKLKAKEIRHIPGILVKGIRRFES